MRDLNLIPFIRFDSMKRSNATITDWVVRFRLGEKHYFYADVRTRLEQLTETTCKTNDVGFLPSGFPFQIFEDGTKVSIESYAKRMKEVGVPAGYVDALVQLGIQLDTYKGFENSPPCVLH